MSYSKSARKSLASFKSATAPKKSFRPDIQGLRAFAVVVVILDHLVHWPSGGFIGVDVFFVISGFLITGQLLRQYENTGQLSFKGFYLRRVKRILPASLLVLAVTVICAKFIFNSSRFIETLWDGIWATLFAANWRFASEGTDYFQADGPVSPLQHYWSLSVEEQFYFVWPWLMLGAFFIFLRGERRNDPRAVRLVAGAAITVVSLASIAWALYETANNPALSYFSTFSRGWELGLGALLAVLTPLLEKIPLALRIYIAWSGIAGLLASLFMISNATPFPAPAALLPVLATMMVIAAGTGAPPHRSLSFLTNRVSGYLGNISYSLYLWHFPVIIFLGQFMDNESTYYLLALSMMLVASVFAYHLVEDPIRKPGWGKKFATSIRNPATISHRYRVTAVGLLATITAGLVAVLLISPPNVMPPAAKAFVPAPTTTHESIEAEQLPPKLAALQNQISAALQASTWPDLAMSMDEALDAPQAPASIATCGDPGPLDVDRCTLGSGTAPRTAIVLGDSIAMTMANPVQKALGDDWKVVSGGMYGCSFSSVTVANSDPAIVEGCGARNAGSMRLVQELQPDAVFIANSYAPRTELGKTAPMPSAQWAETVRVAASELVVDPNKIVFLSAPPADKDPKECYNRVRSPSDCVSAIQASWSDVFNAESGVAKANRWSVVDTRRLYCLDRFCPAFVGDVPTKSDRAHITIEYGERIAPALRELMPPTLGL